MISNEHWAILITEIVRRPGGLKVGHQTGSRSGLVLWGGRGSSKSHSRMSAFVALEMQDRARRVGEFGLAQAPGGPAAWLDFGDVFPVLSFRRTSQNFSMSGRSSQNMHSKRVAQTAWTCRWKNCFWMRAGSVARNQTRWSPSSRKSSCLPVAQPRETLFSVRLKESGLVHNLNNLRAVETKMTVVKYAAF